IDAPGESVENRLDLRPVDAKSGIGDRRRWRRGQSAANNDAAGVLTDIENSLFAVVAAHLPVHQGRIPGRGFLIVDTLVVEVIEPDTFPAGRLKRKFERRRRRLLSAALSSALASTLGLTLSAIRLLLCSSLAENARGQHQPGSGKRKEIPARKRTSHVACT